MKLRLELQLFSILSLIKTGTARDYAPGERIPVQVNAITSASNEGSSKLNSLISFDHYDSRFQQCQTTPASPASEALGAILFGDRLYSNEDIEVNFLENQTCVPMCIQSLFPDTTAFLRDRIKESYEINLIIDSLPAAELQEDVNGNRFYSMGFPIGNVNQVDGINLESELEPVVELNNHYDILLEYHKNKIVGVVIFPYSLDSLSDSPQKPNCNTQTPLILEAIPSSKRVAYTYSVSFIPSEVTYNNRFDAYLRIMNPKVHLLSVINSLIIALFLCSLVGGILLAVLKKDVTRYTEIDLGNDYQDDDKNWKVLSTEVWRPPKKRNILSALIGSGVQLVAMSGAVLIFSCLNILSPQNRGSLATALMVCFNLFGILAGYTSSRIYASFNGSEWKLNLLFTTLLFPSILFFFFLFLNLFLISVNGSGAVPIGTILFILIIFFFVNIPLTLLGSWLGIKKGGFVHPTRVNPIPRQIPAADWYMRPFFTSIVAGVFPFAAMFIEFYYIFASFVGNRSYIAFGFLLISLLIVLLTNSVITVLFCYFQLSIEDNRWQWRSFLNGGGSSFYIIICGLLYLFKINLPGFVNKVLFLGYLGLIAASNFVIQGSVGFLATYFFLHVIYSRVRVD